MIGKAATVCGFSGTGLQVFLQVYASRHPGMNDTTYWSLLIMSLALILFGGGYGLWHCWRWLSTADYKWPITHTGTNSGSQRVMETAPLRATPKQIARLRKLASEAIEIGYQWPGENRARFQQSALAAIGETAGQESGFYKAFDALTFGGQPPVSWGKGLEWMRGEPPEVVAFRDAQIHDFRDAKGILEALVEQLESTE